MIDQLVVFLVVAPIVGAVVTSGLAFGGRRGGWAVATATLAATVGLAGALALDVVRRGRRSYAVGGFELPFAVELVADGLAVAICLTVAVVALGALLTTRRDHRSNHFFGAYLFLTAGMYGLTVAGDLFTMYIFLEITGLAAYALVATGKGGGATYAAFKYLVLGTVGASLFLFGVGYLYVATGGLNMVDVSDRLAGAGYQSPLVLAGATFLVVGLAVKIPLVPVHTWLPDAHSKAPPAVSAVISGLVTAVAAYALARVLFTVLTVEFLATVPVVRWTLLLLASGGILVGTVLAIRQRSIKRMLAYSTISQIGLVVVGIAVLNVTALTGSVIHIAGHAIMKAGLFLAAGVVASRYAATTVEGYDGLGRRAPVTSGAFAVLALAMVGIPPGIGFFGKWYVALGAVQAELWPVAVVVFASTLLTLAYFVRLFERMYVGTPAPTDHATGDVEAVPDGGDPGEHDVTDGGDGGQAASHDGGTSAWADLAADPWTVTVVVAAAVGAVLFGLLSDQAVVLLEPALEEVLG